MRGAAGGRTSAPRAPPSSIWLTRDGGASWTRQSVPPGVACNGDCAPRLVYPYPLEWVTCLSSGLCQAGGGHLLGGHLGFADAVLVTRGPGRPWACDPPGRVGISACFWPAARVRQKIPTRQKMPFCVPPTDTAGSSTGRDCARLSRALRTVRDPGYRQAGMRPGRKFMQHRDWHECPLLLPREWLSELLWPVDVRPVFNGQDSNLPDVVADTVDDPVVTAPCAVEPAKAEPQRLADPVRIRSQGAIGELHCCGRDLLGQPAQRTASRGCPGDREVTIAHRSAIRLRASSLVSTGASPAPSSARLSRMSSRSGALSMTSRVSSRDSRSSRLMTTAAGWPCLVITTRPCSRSSLSTTSDSRFFTSARDICSAGDIAISIANFERGPDSEHLVMPRTVSSATGTG